MLILICLPIRNLQAAVGAYFDFESQNTNFIFNLPSMKFNAKTELPSCLPPNTPFNYACSLVNSGDDIWPVGCSLRWCGGTQMSNDERIILPCLLPGQSSELIMQMVTPDEVGYYTSMWRPATITGQFFGGKPLKLHSHWF